MDALEGGTAWLDDAVIYEIYPQSFADSNGDGIGDLQGVIDHLDHLAWLGVNTIWFNPCFASPFRDAGYDVSDYLQIAPRYGTNEDLVELCAGRASAASGYCSTSSPATPRSRTRGSSRSRTVTPTARPTATATSGAHAGRRQRPRRALGCLPRHPARLVPQELLRRAAGAELRLRPARPRRAVAPARRRRRAGRQPGRAPGDHGVLVRPRGGRVPGRHGLLAGQGRPRPRGDGRAVARPVATGSTRPTPMPSCSRRATSARRSTSVCGRVSTRDFFLVNQAAHSALFNNGGAGTLWWLPDHEHCFFDADGPDGPG